MAGGRRGRCRRQTKKRLTSRIKVLRMRETSRRRRRKSGKVYMEGGEGSSTRAGERTEETAQPRWRGFPRGNIDGSLLTPGNHATMIHLIDCCSTPRHIQVSPHPCTSRRLLSLPSSRSSLNGAPTAQILPQLPGSDIRRCPGFARRLHNPFTRRLATPPRPAPPRGSSSRLSPVHLFRHSAVNTPPRLSPTTVDQVAHCMAHKPTGTELLPANGAVPHASDLRPGSLHQPQPSGL